MAKTKDDFAVLRDRIIITMLIAYGLSFLFFLGYSFFTFPEKLFLRPFRVRWTMIQTVVYFISTLNPVQCTAVLLACSFTAPPAASLKTRPEDAFSRLIATSLTVLILFGAVFVVLSEGWLPNLMQNLGRLEDRTVIARNYLKLAEKTRAEGDLALSAAYLKFYLTDDPNNESAGTMLSDVRRRMGNTVEIVSADEADRRARLTELDPDELIEKARSSIEGQDFFTAYYFADLAKELSPAGSAAYGIADELAASIQERLSSYQADAAELESKVLFEIKTRGFNDLSSDDVELVSRAYYTFLMLENRYPDDAEVTHYFNQSITKLKTMAFFSREVDDLLAMPGPEDIFFVNSSAGDETVEVVAIAGIISSENGAYAQNIEVVSFRPDGSILCQLSAKIGKIMRDGEGRLAIFMRGIDSNNSAGTQLPEYLQQETDGACTEILYLNPAITSTDTFVLLGRSGREPDRYYLTKLWGLWETVSPLGYPSDVIQISALMRIVSAFGILILSLLALAVGWRLRSPTGMPSVGGILFIPVFPFIAYFVIELYEYIHRLIVGSVLVAWGFMPSLIVLFALEFVLLSFSILILSIQAFLVREPR